MTQTKGKRMPEAIGIDPHWYEHAACNGQGLSQYFDDADPTPAQRICAGCPVRVSCLRFAMVHQLDSGIWGGLTSEQRRRLKVNQRVA